MTRIASLGSCLFVFACTAPLEPSVGSKIAHGDDALDAEYALRLRAVPRSGPDPSSLCTAAYLGDGFVLTAGHCISSSDDVLTVDTTSADGWVARGEVHDVALHPTRTAALAGGGCETELPVADIALLSLREPLRFTVDAAGEPLERRDQREVDPVTIAETIDSSGRATVFGFGRTEAGSPSATRRSGEFILLPVQETDLLIANSASRGGADVTTLCQGDSGGPVVQYGQAVAIASGVVGGGRCGTRAVLTPIAPYVQWLNDMADAMYNGERSSLAGLKCIDPSVTPDFLRMFATGEASGVQLTSDFRGHARPSGELRLQVWNVGAEGRQPIEHARVALRVIDRNQLIAEAELVSDGLGGFTSVDLGTFAGASTRARWEVQVQTNQPTARVRVQLDLQF